LRKSAPRLDSARWQDFDAATSARGVAQAGDPTVAGETFRTSFTNLQ
jgi:hypothetical protein